MIGKKNSQRYPPRLRAIGAIIAVFAILMAVPAVQARDYDIDRTMKISPQKSAYIDVEDQSRDFYINLTSDNPVCVYIIPPGQTLGADPSQSSLSSLSLKTWKNVTRMKDEVFSPNTDRDATDKVYKLYIFNAGSKAANVTVYIDNWEKLSTGEYALFICICLAVIPLFILLMAVGIYFRWRRVQRQGLRGLFSRR